MNHNMFLDFGLNAIWMGSVLSILVVDLVGSRFEFTDYWWIIPAILLIGICYYNINFTKIKNSI